MRCDNFLLYLLVVMLLFFIGTVAFKIGKDIYHFNDVVLVKTNDFGCKRYKHKKTDWWECPKSFNAKYIVETVPFNRGHKEVLIPVYEINNGNNP